MKHLLLTTLALSFTFTASAFDGSESGGGGDASEIRVDEIRSDILSWIQKEGSKALSLPKHLSHEEYVAKMTETLAPKTVVIGFVEKDDPTNEELQVTVKGVPKTCRGFVSKIDLRPHIICNIARFEATSDSNQYRLIHHEYAGLARVEKNVGAASDYEISDQLTDYLVTIPTLKLAVKNKDSKSEEIEKKLLSKFMTYHKLRTFVAEENLYEDDCSWCYSRHDSSPMDIENKARNACEEGVDKATSGEIDYAFLERSKNSLPPQSDMRVRKSASGGPRDIHVGNGKYKTKYFTWKTTKYSWEEVGLRISGKIDGCTTTCKTRTVAGRELTKCEALPNVVSPTVENVPLKASFEENQTCTGLVFLNCGDSEKSNIKLTEKN